MASLLQRMLRAALLDWRVYEEVEADRKATLQAIIVVLLSSLAGAVGSSGGVRTFPFYMTAFLGAWFTWAALTYWIGTRLLAEPQTDADFGQLLRTIGFAGTPGLLLALGKISAIRSPLFAIVFLWILLATILAVRQALDYSSLIRAFLVCLIGALVHLLVLLLATTTAA